MNTTDETRLLSSKFKWKDDLEIKYNNAISSASNSKYIVNDFEFLSTNLINTIKKTAKDLGMTSNINNKVSLIKPWVDNECREIKKTLKITLKECRSEGFLSDITKQYNDFKKIHEKLFENKVL